MNLREIEAIAANIPAAKQKARRGEKPDALLS
jgi:hypothetical protein